MGRNRHPSASWVQKQIEDGIAKDRERQKLKKPPAPDHEAPLVSKAESKFRERATKRGWNVHRSGWPDFIVQRSGEVHLVEVKGKGDRLRPSQRRAFAALELLGIQVRIWWELRPEGLLPWRAFDKLTTPPSRRVGAAVRAEPLRG